MVAAGLVMLLIDVFFNTEQVRLARSSWIVTVIAVISVILPPQSLSQQIASSRVSESINTLSSPQSTYDSFSRDLSRFDIVDWINFLNTKPAENQISGKQARLTGFVFSDDKNQKFIARFKLTCCAVDASPLTVALADTDNTKNLVLGEWVEISGSFVFLKDAAYPYQLNPEEINSIAEPKEPYVF